MNFTYHVIDYDVHDQCLNVLYKPSDESLTPWINKVFVRDDMNDDQVKARIIESFPFYRWEVKEIESAKNAVSTSDSATFVKQPHNFPATAEQLARRQRNGALAATDWTSLSDAPLTSEKKSQYAAFRQALRDVPQQSGFPDNIVWPEKP